MSDVREMLDGIEKQTEKALRPGTSVYRALDKTVIDNRVLVAALRAVLDAVEAMPHDVSEEDCWYACAQAKDPYTGEWASCNDDRAGGPCDCGRDEFVAKVTRAITEALGGGA